MLEREVIDDAIRMTIAQKILDSIDSGTRDALLTQSITKALTEYRFLGAVADVAADKARRIATEMVESPEWSERIRETIESGFDDYLEHLRGAIPETLKDAFHGEQGDSYSRTAGRILKWWPGLYKK